MIAAVEAASTFQKLGAAGFGAIVGWYLYFVTRYRSDAVSIADVGSLVAAIGGSAVLAMFPAKTDLFGAYGIGLFVGFFGYLAMLVVLVARSDNFTADWFLDGRRKNVAADETTVGIRQTSQAMGGSSSRVPA